MISPVSSFLSGVETYSLLLISGWQKEVSDPFANFATASLNVLLSRWKKS